MSVFCIGWWRYPFLLLTGFIAQLGWNRPAEAQSVHRSPRIIDAHRQLVRWVGFSPDGKSLATASFDGSLQLRDAASGNLHKTLAGHLNKVYWGSFSIDGQTLVSGGDDAVVRVWSLDNRRVRTEFRGQTSAAWTGRITPDGRRIVSGGDDSMVFIWDILDGKLERSFKHSTSVWWIDVSHDSRFISVAAENGKVTLYELATGKALKTFGNHKGGLFCAAFSPNDRLIATAGADNDVKIWSTENAELKNTLPHFGAVYSLAFSPSGKLLATGGADYSLRLWKVDEWAFHEKLTGHTDAIWTIAFDSIAPQMASAGADGKVFIWNLDGELDTPPQKLPHRVDLRPVLKKYGLPIVEQGTRNTCSVHVFTRALEFAISKQENRGVRLSDEYLNWACNQVISNTGSQATDRGQFFEHLWMGYSKHGICTAAAMPCQETFDPSTRPSTQAAKNAAAIKRNRIEWHDISGPGVPDAAVIERAKSVLANGWPLLAGSSHSLFVVGYVDQPGGGFFIVADSGTGTYLERVTTDPLHSAIPYSRVKDYGFSWIECVSPTSK